MERKQSKRAAQASCYDIECGARFRRFRKQVLDWQSANHFAERMNTSVANLSNWELGVYGIPPQFVANVSRTFGAPGLVEYVYTGDIGALRRSHADKLEEEPGRGGDSDL